MYQFDQISSEILYRLPISLAVFDKEMCFLAYSKRWVEDYELQEQGDLLGKSHYEVFPNFDPALKEVHVRGLAGASESAKGAIFRRNDGKMLHLNWEMNPWFTQDGDIGGIVVSTIDITTEVEETSKNKSLQKDLQKAQQIAGLGIWKYDLTNSTLEWSDEIYKIFGLSKEKFTPSYEKFLSVVHPEDRKKVSQAYETSLKTKEGYKISHRLLMEDGTIKHVQEQCDTEFASDGTPLYSLGTVYDVTQITKQKEHYRVLLNASSDGIHILTNDGYLINANQKFADMLGYEKVDELIGMHVRDWDVKIPEDDLPPIIESLIDNPKTFDTIHQRQDGTVYDAQVTAKGVSISGIEYLYASAHDITHRKELEHKLKHNEERFRDITKSVSDLVWEIDTEAKYTYISSNTGTAFGYSEEEVIGKSIFDFIPEDEVQRVRHVFSEHVKGRKEVKNFVSTHLNKDGTQSILETTGKPIIDGYGNMIGFRGANKDITKSHKMSQELENYKNSLEKLVEEQVGKLREQEQTILSQQRLSQMGEMISMIAHQWRQPLSAIAATTLDSQMLIKLDTTQDGVACKESVLKSLDDIENFVQSLSQTLDDFRNFYKPDKDAQNVYLNSLVEKSMRIMSSSFDLYEIEVHVEVDSVKRFEIHENEMIQVIINILKNAQDNFIDKKIENPRIEISCDDNESGASICIKDNGGGIDDEILPLIFDPYFSTKDEKNGTGLGLYMSKMIVEKNHNASISVENIGEGVCFKIEFLHNS